MLQCILYNWKYIDMLEGSRRGRGRRMEEEGQGKEDGGDEEGEGKEEEDGGGGAGDGGWRG